MLAWSSILPGRLKVRSSKPDVLQRADADAEVFVAAEFEVRLVVELELADVGDAPQGDVVDGAVERGAVVEAFHAGQQADGVGGGNAIRRAGDVLDEDVVDRAVAGRVVFPLPCVQRDRVIPRIAPHAADDAVAGRAVDVDAIAAMTVQREAVHGELVRIGQMHGEGLALPDGEVADGHAADVVQQDDAVRAGDGLLSSTMRRAGCRCAP